MLLSKRFDRYEGRGFEVQRLTSISWATALACLRVPPPFVENALHPGSYEDWLPSPATEAGRRRNCVYFSGRPALRRPSASR